MKRCNTGKMKHDSSVFSFAILSLLLVMIQCINISSGNDRVKESQLDNNSNGVKGHLAHTREKRVALVTLKMIGRKAVNFLKTDAVPKAVREKYIRVYEKRGSITKAEQDFDSINPKITQKGTFTNGMEYRRGEVGDQVITITTDATRGRAEIESFTNRKYSAVRGGIVTKILYHE